MIRAHNNETMMPIKRLGPICSIKNKNAPSVINTGLILNIAEASASPSLEKAKKKSEAKLIDKEETKVIKHEKNMSLSSSLQAAEFEQIKEQIINLQKIDVSNDDLEKRKKELIEKDPQNAKSIKVFLKDANNQQKFFDDILNEKLFNYLKEFAIIKVDEKNSDELRKMQGATK